MAGMVKSTIANPAIVQLLPRVQSLVQTAEAECGVTYVAVPRPMYLANDANGKPITEIRELCKVKRCIEDRLRRAS